MGQRRASPSNENMFSEHFLTFLIFYWPGIISKKGWFCGAGMKIFSIFALDAGDYPRVV